MFDLHDWYWWVGGDGPHLAEEGDHFEVLTHVYSSKRSAYFIKEDAEYVAWRDTKLAQSGYDPTTRIDTAANLQAVLEAGGLEYYTNR